MRPNCIFGMVLVFGAILQAQDNPDAPELLRDLAARYTNAKQYHLAGQARISQKRAGNPDNQSVHTFLIAMQRPDKVHIEMTPHAGQRAVYVISNGKSGWLYSPTGNEYMKVKPGQAPTDLPRGVEYIFGANEQV